MLKIWAQGGVYTKYKGLRGFCLVGMNSQTQITYVYMYYTLIHSYGFQSYTYPRFQDGRHYGGHFGQQSRNCRNSDLWTFEP